MDPLENDFQYSPNEQEEHQRQQDALQDLLRRQQEEAAQQADLEATETPDPEEQPRTQSEVFQNPLGDIPGAAQQASDSTREGMGQMFEAIGGAMDNVLGSISEERSEERDADRKAGKGGDERNVVGALQGLVQQGLDLLPEELTKDRGLDVGPKLDDMSESDRVMAGTVLGTGESLLEFGELVGDFSKTLASKANIVGYDPKDDPFSNQYNWASWNLGKDELGAQTGAGKVAQGFGEFALTFYATGGGKAVSQLFTTGLKQAGAKGILSAAGKEALEGVAADMVMAASGEGNLSNLIQDHAPEWYPTWLSALAVDEDDNPFEAALKTGFEGSLLGFPVGAVGAFLSGARRAAKLPAGATQAERQEAALQGAYEKLRAQGPKSKRLSYIEEYEKFAGASAQTTVLKSLEDAGIPSTWDDVANVRPDLFIPGSRQIEAPEFHPDAMKQIADLDPTDPDAGLSVHPFTGETPTNGTFVAIDRHKALGAPWTNISWLTIGPV